MMIPTMIAATQAAMYNAPSKTANENVPKPIESPPLQPPCVIDEVTKFGNLRIP